MRILLLSLLASTFCLPAFAQEAVSVRAGEHRGYTRLVFDWPQDVTYSVKEESGRFTVQFDKAATVDASVKGKNVAGMTVQSKDPLVVVIDSPAGAKLRSFSVRSRVVMDIYDPSLTPQADKENKTPQADKENKTPQADKENKTPQADPQKQADKPAEPAPVSGAKTPKSAAPLKPVEAGSVKTPDEKELESVQNAVRNVENLVAEMVNEDARRAQAMMQAQADQAAQEQDKPAAAPDPSAKGADNAASAAKPIAPSDAKTDASEQASAPAPEANKFTISATKSLGMAVFENAGQIWMVGDRDDVVVKPQIEGPDKDFFAPLQTRELTGGQGFAVPAMPGADMRAQGGGLLWTLSVAPRKGLNAPSPKEPVRQGVQAGKIHGGTVLFPFTSARKVLDVPDAASGLVLKVVAVENAEDFSGPAREFVEFSVLPAPLGLAIRPKVDDLAVTITKEGVVVSRPEGLSVLTNEQVASAPKSAASKTPEEGGDNDQRLLHFKDWRMGGLPALNENRMIILSSMGGMTHGSQIENLMTLAKTQLANGRGAEAIGFLNFAAAELPELEQNPEFLALRGVANAFDWKTDEGFEDLSSPILDEYEEIKLWQAFSLADLGDWQQAYEVLPPDLADIVSAYPDEIRNRLIMALAEVYLRAGERQKAEDLFALIGNHDKLNQAHDAALKYLQGEAARQRGEFDTTRKLWGDLAAGKDDLYRVKSGLALARLQVDRGEIKPAAAIDALERLRYAWRGDELEANVHYWLGRTYFQAGDYIKGLKIMRDAALLDPDSLLGKRIAGDMRAMFTDFYTGDTLDKVSPLDAVALYQEFKTLVPPGPEGDKVISNLAEHLVRADLLDRAGDLLQYQINERLSGDEAARTATRLAAIQLIDKKGADAVKSLAKAEEILKTLPETVATPQRFEELALLRARALSQEGKTVAALDILEDMEPDAGNNRLRADIAWRNGLWDDAAYALEDVILDENISPTRPLSDEHAALILQRAVALNLSGDRIGLNNLREKFATGMSQTNKARLFDVVTRTRQNAGLADRETLLSTVSEVDLFGDFLNSYRETNTDKPPSN